jgi:hypothetical protein
VSHRRAFGEGRSRPQKELPTIETESDEEAKRVEKHRRETRRAEKQAATSRTSQETAFASTTTSPIQQTAQKDTFAELTELGQHPLFAQQIALNSPTEPPRLPPPFNPSFFNPPAQQPKPSTSVNPTGGFTLATTTQQGPPNSPEQSPPSTPSNTRPSSPMSTKEKGKQPKEFEKKEDYVRFRQQLLVYLQLNGTIYSTDDEKIMFTLGFFTEGLPKQWATTFLEHADRNTAQGDPLALGTWTDFYTQLQTSFEDPNISRNSYDKLKRLHWTAPADTFFQEFDMLARRCGYITATTTDDRILIDLLEDKLPRGTVEVIYQNTVPTTYATYKDAVIKHDNLWRRLQNITGTKKNKGKRNASGRSYVPPPRAPSNDRRTGTGTTYGGQGKPMNIGATTKTTSSPTACFQCGKEGHRKAQCPDWKKGAEIRAMLAALSEEDCNELREDFQRI